MEVTTSLFDGVTDEEYAAMKICFKAVVKTYKKNEEISIAKDRVGVVQKGEASLLKTDLNGIRTIFEQLKPGGVFGNMLAFSGPDADFFIVCDEDCEILFIDYEHIVKRCPNACAHHSVVVQNLGKLMSEKTQALSEHLEILSRRSIREKLLAYFIMLATKNKNFYFTLPFSQTRLADYICVDRSAMLRELKKMSVEGIIDIDKRNVKLCLQHLKKEQS